MVVTSNVYNEHNWVIVVVPLTSHAQAKYDQVLVLPPEGGLTSPSVVLPIRCAIDRQRLVKRLGNLSPVSIERLDRSLRIVLDLKR